jgi:hypothetical protein
MNMVAGIMRMNRVVLRFKDVHGVLQAVIAMNWVVGTYGIKPLATALPIFLIVHGKLTTIVTSKDVGTTTATRLVRIHPTL